MIEKRMAHRKRHSPSKLAQAKPRLPKSVGLFIAIAAALVLAGIPFALGKYIELNSPGPFDSGAYVYSAKHLLEGARLGVEEQSSAKPDTLLANIIGVKLFGFNDTGPKIIQMFMQIAAGVFMFYALRRVFGNIAAVIAITIAAIYLSAPLIAKYGNVKEQFMIAFMFYAGCCFLLHEHTQKSYWLLLTGFFALQPFYFKATGLSIVIAIVLYIFLKNIFAKRGKALCLELLLFLGGYAAGLFIPLTLYLWQKQPTQLFRTFPAVVLQIGLLLTVLLAVVVYGYRKISKLIHLINFKKVPKKIWLTGLILIVIAFALSILSIRFTSGFQEGDIYSYIRSIPIVSIPTKIITIVWYKLYDAAGLQSGYLAGARIAIGMNEVAAKVGRYYMALKVPILLALTSIILATLVWISNLRKKMIPQAFQSKIVWMLAIWWLLDMAFVWISPRSYEQYYLPLCASAAVLSGYAVWLWTRKLISANNKTPWLATGLIAVSLLGILTVPIFTGLQHSPDTGGEYGSRQRGYAQSLARVKAGYQQAWQAVGEYIRTHSTEDDTIYVWGWVPGIYVEAQRLAPIPTAFESDMHIKSPMQLTFQIQDMIDEMKENPPKFIVDTRKRHVPWNRPPLELWPVVPADMFGNQNPRYLKNDPREIAAFDAFYENILETRINSEEAQRYKAMKPFRDFVMTYYKPIIRQFGDHRLYERVSQPKTTQP